MKSPSALSEREEPIPEKSRARLSPAFVVLAAIPVLAPMVVLAVLIDRYGVNMPFSDQWMFVEMIRESKTTGLTAADFFAQHGEQRMFFPRVIMILLAYLTDWNIRAELFVNLALAAGIFGGLLFALLRTLRSIGWWAVLPAVGLSLAVFSPVQWEDWFWGWQISWFLPLFCFVVAACVLWAWPESRPAWPAMLIASAAAIVGQLSLLSGTLIWVMCLPIILVRAKLRRLAWLWGALGVLCTVGYMYRYVSPANMADMHATPGELLDDPKRPVAYLLYLLGRPVLDAEPSYTVGAAFLVAYGLSAGYLLLRRRDRWEAASIWLAVATYALAAGSLTTVGRLDLGLPLAGSSRYTTTGILFMVGVLGLVAVALAPEPGAGKFRLRAAGIVGAWGLVTLLFLVDYPSEVAMMKEWHAQKLAIKSCVENATGPQDPCLITAYPIPEDLYNGVQYLKSIGWAGFEPSTPAGP
jgi:hypothetical protein